MDEEYDFEDKSEQEVQKYSKSTEKTLLQAVSALERYQDFLTIFASKSPGFYLWKWAECKSTCGGAFT